MRVRRRSGKPNNTKWSPHIDRMVMMAESGASYTEIGKFFGAPSSTIRNALSRRGRYVTRKDVAKPQWQPIETAPKDGSHVLLCDDGWFCIAGWWDDAPRDEGGQCFKNSQSHLWLNPSHWMPLPKPPIE